MPIDVKKARQAIDNAQHAGRQAKYFLKFMSALNDLDDALADLGGIEGQALAAEKRKEEAERQTPEVEKRLAELQQAKANVGAEYQAQVDANERDLRAKMGARKQEEDQKHEARKAELQAEISNLETQEKALLATIGDLVRQKKAAEAAIERINKSLQRAGQSLVQPNA